MGTATNQIATYKDAAEKIGINLDSLGAISSSPKCITYYDLYYSPWAYFYSGGDSTNKKAVKYSNLSLLTGSKSLTVQVKLLNYTTAAYWGTQNTNGSNTFKVYIKNGSTTLATYEFKNGTTNLSKTVSIPVTGFTISLDGAIHFKDRIIANNGYRVSSMSVQPKISISASGIVPYRSTTLSYSLYSLNTIAHNAVATLGPWMVGVDAMSVGRVQGSGTITIEVDFRSTVSVIEGTFAGGANGGSQKAIGLFDE